MMKILSGFPDDVLAISAEGKITAEDYRTVLEPALDAKLEDHSKLKMFYRLGEDFDSMSAGAMWEDAKTGISYWRAFERVAVVTDKEWVRQAARMFTPLMPCLVRVFSLAEDAEAREWLNATDAQAA